MYNNSYDGYFYERITIFYIKKFIFISIFHPCDKLVSELMRFPRTSFDQSYLRYRLLAANLVNLGRFYRLRRRLDRLSERDIVDDLLPRSLRGFLRWTVLNRRRGWRRDASPDDARRRHRHLGRTIHWRWSGDHWRYRSTERPHRWIRQHSARHLLAHLLFAVRFLAQIARILVVALAERLARHVLFLGLLVHRLHVLCEQRRGRRQIRSRWTERTGCIIPRATRSAILSFGKKF